MGVLWYVGFKNRAQREKYEAEILAEIIEKNRNLRNIVEDNLEKKGALQNFNVTSLFEEEIELDVLATVTEDDLQTYVQNLIDILKPLSGNRKHEVRIMLEAMDNNDPILIKDIVSARLTFDSIINRLIKLPAPAETAVFQKDLVVSLQKLSFLAGQMEKALDEPVLALQSGQTYLNETGTIINLTTKLNDFLQKTGVIGPEYKIVITFKKDKNEI